MMWKDFVFRDEMVRLVETRRQDGRTCLSIMIGPGQVLHAIVTPGIYPMEGIHVSWSGSEPRVRASLHNTKPFHEGGDEMDGHFNEGNLTEHDYKKR